MLEKLNEKLEKEIDKLCKKEDLSIEEVKVLSEIKTYLEMAKDFSEKPKFEPNMLNNCCVEKKGDD